VERVDRRSNVFGLGAILCEVLTGQPPFLGTHEEMKSQARVGHLGLAQQRLEACRADSDLVALALSCSAARPEDRPADAVEVAALLVSYLDAAEKRFSEVEARRIRADAIADELRKRRRVELALAVAVALLAACTALALR
jgi:serine/threonine-protein kinase